ncbi:DUF1236 domain-containing protein [Bradyrhizobium diazoefficiens]|nr:DUF1236 domain-containing protein [Bradyrhizobium diazoefficiens]MBR0775449.1 DUF1236 domain-containing protein [Bradyrhizobium diazoefficiens]MBR0849895.1 DUF1236 domain-containing protein [Bradyrhizobium diazoefficiens]
MSNRFMISVAALALVAGTGLANAQGTMNRESGGAGAQPTQHSQPSGGAAERGSMGKESAKPEKGTVGQAGGSSTMKSGEEKSSGAMKDEHSGREMNKNATEDKSGATKGQRTDERAQGQQDKSKSMSQDTKSGAKDMKAEDNKAGGAAKSNSAETRPAATDSKSQTTTGNAATSATAAPPAEKRTQIASEIKSANIQEATNVNFNVSVGATIPASVHFYPLPARIVEIYPEWRGYEVIRVHGRYVIVRPQTREIVYIIEG